jgi:hypothetical protein
MGRKGVSKRKKSQVKVKQAAGNDSTFTGQMAENLPKLASDKSKTWSKEKKKR